MHEISCINKMQIEEKLLSAEFKKELVDIFKDNEVIAKNDAVTIVCSKEKQLFGILDAFGSFLVMKDGDIIIQPAHILHLAPFNPMQNQEDKIMMDKICLPLQD